jgi:hypothetical protein
LPVRSGALLAACLALGLGAGLSPGRYIRPDLEEVPVARLVENLQKAIETKPKDARLRLNLARVHAMAYALKTDKAQVNKRIDALAAWFGYEAKFVPFTPKATDDADRRATAREHLKKATASYREAIKLAPDDLAARLGLAWTTEQAGNKDEAIRQYRDVITRGWKNEKKLKAGPIGGNYITVEAAGYLIPLLDKTADREEIATLQERSAQLRKLPRPVTPIAIPLRDGLGAADLVDRSARVAFDLDGTGLAQRWTWITPQAGWLVYDGRGRGQVGSGLQLFGNVTFWLFWANGYDALASLDDNGDGRLTGDELKHLAIWHDRNGNGVVDPGEVKSLAEWGIVELSCRSRPGPSAGCAAWVPTGVVFRDGSTRPTFDVILERR